MWVTPSLTLPPTPLPFIIILISTSHFLFIIRVNGNPKRILNELKIDELELCPCKRVVSLNQREVNHRCFIVTCQQARLDLSRVCKYLCRNLGQADAIAKCEIKLKIGERYSVMIDQFMSSESECECVGGRNVLCLYFLWQSVAALFISSWHLRGKPSIVWHVTDKSII